MSLGRSGFVPGTSRVCPWDIPGVVPRATGPNILCLCAFLFPEIWVMERTHILSSKLLLAKSGGKQGLRRSAVTGRGLTSISWSKHSTGPTPDGWGGVARGVNTVKRFGKTVQGEIIYAPPPPPISGQKAFSSGGGWGCIFWGPVNRLSRKCRNPRGSFFCVRTQSEVNFLEQKERKKSTPISTAKFKSEFGSFAAKIHTARIWPGEIKVSTSTVAALFSKMALTGQRIAMVDLVFLVFTAYSYLP